MESTSLIDYENAANDAYQALQKAEDAVTAATEKTASAEEAYYDALGEYYENPSPENLEKMQAAQDALDTAKDEESKAADAKEQALKDAEDAAEAVEQKKEELRQSRHTDTTYVVHCARVECTYGMRESYLALGPTHGVITRQVPQMTVDDTTLDINIINFGGCKSKENPTLWEAAEEAARNANVEIEKSTSWGKKLVDKIVGRFCGESEIEVSESLLEQCMGECIACFPEGAEWRRGHKKVFVNGEPVLLRRCSLRCNFGGEITILLSGQPE